MSSKQPRPIKVMIGCPSYDGRIESGFSDSLQKLFSHPATLQRQVQFEISSIKGDSLVTRARNTTASEFLNSDCEYLFFVDTDLEFEPDLFFDLLKWQKPLACAAYPIKRMHFQLVINGAKGPKTDDGWQQCDEAGTGLMLIHRSVFELMISEWGSQLEYHHETTQRKCWDFFETQRRTTEPLTPARLLSEDYEFCRKWKKLGGEVWINDRHKVKHIGKCAFPLDFAVEAAQACKMPRCTGKEGQIVWETAQMMAGRPGNVVYLGVTDATFVLAERLREAGSLAKTFILPLNFRPDQNKLLAEDIFRLRLQHCMAILDNDSPEESADVIIAPVSAADYTAELLESTVKLLRPGGTIIGDGANIPEHYDKLLNALGQDIQQDAIGIFKWRKPKGRKTHSFDTSEKHGTDSPTDHGTSAPVGGE